MQHLWCECVQQDAFAGNCSYLRAFLLWICVWMYGSKCVAVHVSGSQTRSLNAVAAICADGVEVMTLAQMQV
eukprot:3168914-Pleurochrysis_carterae.AAC.2